MDLKGHKNNIPQGFLSLNGNILLYLD